MVPLPPPSDVADVTGLSPCIEHVNTFELSLVNNIVAIL